MMKKNGKHVKPIKAAIFSDLFNIIKDNVGKTLIHESVCKKHYDNCADLCNDQLVDISERQNYILKEINFKNTFHPCRCQPLNSGRHISLYEDIFIQSDCTGYDIDEPLVFCQGLEHNEDGNDNNEKTLQSQSSRIGHNDELSILCQDLEHDEERNNNNDKEMFYSQNSSRNKTFKNDNESENKPGDLSKQEPRSTSNGNIPSRLNLAYNTMKCFDEVGKGSTYTTNIPVYQQENVSHEINVSQNNTFSNYQCKHETLKNKISQCKYGGCRPSRYNVLAIHDKLKYEEDHKCKANAFRSSHIGSDSERLRMTAPYTSKTYINNEHSEDCIYQNSFTNLDDERPRIAMPYNSTIYNQNDINKDSIYRSSYTNLDGERSRIAMPYNSTIYKENDINKDSIHRSSCTNLDGERPRMVTAYSSSNCDESEINRDSIYRSPYTTLDYERPRMTIAYSSSNCNENEINKDSIYRSSYTNLDGERSRMTASCNLNACGENDVNKSSIYRSTYTNLEDERPRMTMPYGSSNCSENEIHKDNIYRSSYPKSDDERLQMTTSHSFNNCGENDVNRSIIFRSPYTNLDGERLQMTMPSSSNICGENSMNKSSSYRNLYTNLDGERPLTMSHDRQNYGDEKKNANNYRRQFNINNVGTYRGPGTCKPMDNLRCFSFGLSDDSVYKKDYKNHYYDLNAVSMHYGTLECLTNGVTKESVYKKDYNWPCADSETRLQKYFPTSKLNRYSDGKSQLIPLYSPYNLKITPGSDALYRREYSAQTVTTLPGIVKQPDHLKFGPGKMSEMTIYRNDYRRPSHYHHYPFNSHY